MPRKKGSLNKKTIKLDKEITGVVTAPLNSIKSSLKVMGKTCTAEGSTIQEAITNLKPEVARGTGVLTLEKGNIKKERIVNNRIINGVFGKFVSNVNRQIFLKHLLLGFDKSAFE